MIWLIIFLISSLLLVLHYLAKLIGGLDILGNRSCWVWLSAFLAGFVFVMEIGAAAGIMENLAAKRSRVLTIRRELQNIYGTDEDFDQLQPSRCLEEYLEARAKYNELLARAKYYRTHWANYWFGDGAFIDKKVLTMQPF